MFTIVRLFCSRGKKRHWFYSKVYIPPAGSIFDVTFRNKVLAYGVRPNGWPIGGTLWNDRAFSEVNVHER